MRAQPRLPQPLPLLLLLLLFLVAATSRGSCAKLTGIGGDEMYPLQHMPASPPENLPQSEEDVWQKEKERRRAVLERFKARMHEHRRSHNET